MSITIRRITDMSKVGAILSLMIDRFHHEYRDWFPPTNPERMFRYIAHHVTNGASFVAERDGVIVGATCGAPVHYWFSDERYVSEGYFYVVPEARPSRAAVLLLRALQGYADNLGIPLKIGVTSGNDLDRKDRFFERHGMTRIGGMYISSTAVPAPERPS